MVKPDKVILVDDSLSSMVFHEIVCREIFPDVKIFKAQNGEEALDIINGVGNFSSRDVLVTDCRMPEIDGITDGLALISNVKKMGLPILVSMFSGSQDSLDKAEQLGAGPCMLKNGDFHSFWGIVAQWISVRQSVQ